MKRFPATALLSIALVLATVSASLAAPVLETAMPDFNFGQISQGEKVKHTFLFSNSGDETLVVDRVKSSCGCTAALLSAKEIAPGEEGEISTTFDSSRFRGNIRKTVTLYTNAPQQQTARFTLSGQVEPELAAEPAKVALTALPPGETTATEVTLSNRGTRTLNLKVARVTAQGVEATFPESALPPGESTTLEVKIKPPEKLPRINGWIIVSTDSPYSRELRLPVHLSVGP